MNSLNDCEVLPSKGQPTAAVIFLHGTGETGEEPKEHFEHFFRRSGHKYIAFYFPTAPKRYMKIRGTETTFWCDVTRYGPENESVEGDIEQADEVVKMLENMVNELEASGMPRSRIAIGGSSQGGMVAILAAYSRGLKVGAVATVAAPLLFKKSAALLRDVETPLLSLYGSKDAVVTMRFISQSWQAFKAHNITCTPKTVPTGGHDLSRDYVQIIVEWLERQFPVSESESW